MNPIRDLVAKYTPEQLAQLLWEAVRDNMRLRGEVARLEYENWWATKSITRH